MGMTARRHYDLGAVIDPGGQIESIGIGTRQRASGLVECIQNPSIIRQAINAGTAHFAYDIYFDGRQRGSSLGRRAQQWGRGRIALHQSTGGIQTVTRHQQYQQPSGQVAAWRRLSTGFKCFAGLGLGERRRRSFILKRRGVTIWSRAKHRL
jgi:hypothetical protein